MIEWVSALANETPSWPKESTLIGVHRTAVSLQKVGALARVLSLRTEELSRTRPAVHRP